MESRLDRSLMRSERQLRPALALPSEANGSLGESDASRGRDSPPPDDLRDVVRSSHPSILSDPPCVVALFRLSVLLLACQMVSARASAGECPPGSVLLNGDCRRSAADARPLIPLRLVSPGDTGLVLDVRDKQSNRTQTCVLPCTLGVSPGDFAIACAGRPTGFEEEITIAGPSLGMVHVARCRHCLAPGILALGMGGVGSVVSAIALYVSGGRTPFHQNAFDAMVATTILGVVVGAIGVALVILGGGDRIDVIENDPSVTVSAGADPSSASVSPAVLSPVPPSQ